MVKGFDEENLYKKEENSEKIENNEDSLQP
jgi:hypothetical protein